jgi:diaminopimelate decarboxylase
MHHFDYIEGRLHAEGVDLTALAQAVGTPFYCYSTATLTRHYKVYAEAFSDVPSLICYAMKANSNQAVLKTLAQLGAGMDVVSGGELSRAFAAGVPAHKITFSGVGKTMDELALGVREDILCFNVESEPELFMLAEAARAQGKKARISVRVNPDVDAKTHAKITTGKTENKFGIPLSRAMDVYSAAARLPELLVTGVDMHIGSQITDLAPFDDAFAVLADFVRTLRAEGFAIDHLDVGGGLGIPYHDENGAEPPLPSAYADVVKRHLAPLGATIVLEPGRLIAGNAGILVTRVILVKKGEDKSFVIADAAMNDLVRPTLYDAYHAIVPVEPALCAGEPVLSDVVGPVCESGDYMALSRMMPPVEAGQLLAIMSAGAYGAVQAGTYNTRPLIPEVLVKGDAYAVIRPRVSVDELIALDRMPAWL